eukprot:3042531-Pyramimonas_sp.AAC.1
MTRSRRSILQRPCRALLVGVLRPPVGERECESRLAPWKGEEAGNDVPGVAGVGTDKAREESSTSSFRTIVFRATLHSTGERGSTRASSGECVRCRDRPLNNGADSKCALRRALGAGTTRKQTPGRRLVAVLARSIESFGREADGPMRADGRLDQRADHGGRRRATGGPGGTHPIPSIVARLPYSRGDFCPPSPSGFASSVCS